MKLPSAFVSARRLRAAVVAPAETADSDLLTLFRAIVVILVTVGAVAATVAVRMAVRHTALELDAARSELARADILHDRLVVERALLREPGRLQAAADGLALVAPAETVTLAPTASP